MKILFICGSLEHGKDGVGDYTRRLSGELIRQGENVQVVSIHDRFIKELKKNKQTDSATKIQVYRFPSCWAWKNRLYELQLIINDFNPDWVSLQYVAFAFQDKGFPFEMTMKLKLLTKSEKWHIMFHEIWIGIDKQSTLAIKIWGKLQKRLIRCLVSSIIPSKIHTHSKLYKKQLELIGIENDILPLFGNIPVTSSAEKTNSSNTLRFVAFGGIHCGSNIDAFCKWLLELRQDNRNILIDFVGNNGTEAILWHNKLDEYDIDFTVHGIQNVDYIADLLKSCDIGITTTPYLLTEKSGSVAAMLESGLPVICVAREWSASRQELSDITNLAVLNWREDMTLNEIFTSEKKKFTLQSITDQFINSLK